MEPQSLSCLSLKNRYGVAHVKHYYYDDNGDTPAYHLKADILLAASYDDYYDDDNTSD